MQILRQLFLIESLHGYNGNLSVIKRLMSKPKLYFIDPAIAIACLNKTPEWFLKNLNDFGFYFENLVYRDLKTYADYYGGTLSYFLNQNKFEIDFILEFADGKYVAIEVKLGADFETIERAGKNLAKYKQICQQAKDKVLNSKKQRNLNRDWLPDKLIVITGLGTNVFKTVIDGEEIYVIPIKALMP